MIVLKWGRCLPIGQHEVAHMFCISARHICWIFQRAFSIIITRVLMSTFLYSYKLSLLGFITICVLIHTNTSWHSKHSNTRKRGKGNGAIIANCGKGSTETG